MNEQYIHNYVPEGIEILDNGRPDYPMTRNLKVQPQLMGLEYPAMPLGDKTSSGRVNMFTTSYPQALIVKGAEFPQVASGYEREFMKYISNTTRFEQDAMILTVIPRYRTGIGMDPINKCPSWLVVYYGEEDKKVHSIWVSTYTKGTNGFGWDNFIDTRHMHAGVPMAKDSVLSRTYAEKGSKYCLGVNAETCYGTFPSTAEDAIVISDTLAKKFISTSYKELVIDIGPSTVPLNLYGEDGNYKILPDIGETIREDGIVCAFRNVDPLTYYTDMTKEALVRPQRLNDDVKVSEVGTTIVDIEVIRNNNRNVLTPSYVFQQLEKYEQETISFYDKIIQTYEKECVEKGRKPGYTFSSLVTTVGRKLTTVRKRVFGVNRKSLAKYKCKEKPIPFMQLRIMLKHDIIPSRGAKFTGHYGDKGVIADVVPEKHMPINDLGQTAHFLCSSMGVSNRMNPAQLYPGFISELCRIVLNRMRMAPDKLKAYDMMLELFYDLNYEYGRLVDDNIVTDHDKIGFVEEAMAGDYLIVIMPPFLKTANTKWVVDLTKKYEVIKTPIEFDQLDSDGNVVRRIRTKQDFFIGKKYVFLLCKIPFCKGASLGHVNDIEIPNNIKDQNIKSQCMVAPTNLRSGEDETRCSVNNIGSIQTARYLAVNATSPEDAKELGYLLLTSPKPTQLQFIPRTTSDILNRSNSIGAFRSIIAVTGIDIADNIATDEEINTYYKPYNQ